MDNAGPAASATATELSPDPLSATITSPRSPVFRMPSHALLTQRPTLSSSFRHGMTTLISTGCDPAGCIASTPGEQIVVR